MKEGLQGTLFLLLLSAGLYLLLGLFGLTGLVRLVMIAAVLGLLIFIGARGTR